MQVYRGLDDSIQLSRPVAAVGSFDGVHLGHCQILRYLVAYAREHSMQSLVVTFDPHPQQLLRPDSDFFAINSLERNLELIGAQGVDATVVIPFTEEFSKLSYTEFVKQYLIDGLHVGALVMGPNHAMGHNRAGSHDLLKQLCAQYGIEVVEIPELTLREVGVHSSKIRRAIREGDAARASEWLGYPYIIDEEKNNG